MGKPLMFWITGIIFIISLVVMISSGMFNGWIILILVFYVFMYFGGWMFVRHGFKKLKDAEDIINKDRHKFHYCWDRANKLLRAFPGGRGIEWNHGHSNNSFYKTYFDGVQNKAYRSMVGYLEKSKRLALIIYDIDSDDIKVLNNNPLAENLNNHFLGFRPFSRDENDRQDGRGRYNDYGQSRTGYGYGGNDYRRHGEQPPMGNRGYNQPQDQNQYPQEQNIEPSKETVDKVIGTMR